MSMYFDREPEVDFVPYEIHFDYGGKAFRLRSASGVFSKRELDTGSRVLLDACCRLLGPPGHGPAGALLDLGCGIGTLGIVLKRLYPDLELSLADCNRRALDLARENCRDQGLGYVRLHESDAWKGLEGQRYRYVVTNPPIRAGKAVVQDFFRGARAQLEPGGYLLAVVSKHQGAASARRYLTELFGEVEVLGREKGFHVFACRCPEEVCSLN